MSENKVKTTGIWVNESKSGREYFVMKIDGIKILGFENNYKEEGDNRPDYRLFTEGEDDKLVQVGAMWDKTSKEGNNYLFIKIDDLNGKQYILRAFPTKEQKSDKSPDLVAFFDEGEAAEQQDSESKSSGKKMFGNNAKNSSRFKKSSKYKKQHGR